MFSSISENVSDDVIKLMNEQSLRELHEKHDHEPRQNALPVSTSSLIAPSGIAAPSTQMPNLDNTKIPTSALYSMRGGRI